MCKIKLAIIFGGKSSEYSVSLHSAESAIENIDRTKYDVTLIGISQTGNWYQFTGGVEEVAHDTWQDNPNNVDVILSNNQNYKGFLKVENNTFSLLEIDCILPILHGKNGEDGTIQGLLALANIPFVGCDHLSSAIAMDKDYTHIICESAGVPMAPYVSYLNSDNFDYIEAFENAQSTLSFPMFVKPANAGSSYGISKVNNKEEFIEGLKFAFKHDKKIIVETGIEGFEVGCAVLGNDYTNLVVGEIDQINTHNAFFDFEAKYEMQNTKILCPAEISDDLKNQVVEMAKKIYKTLGCEGMSRVDLFITPQNTIIFNEVNTIPGFTKASRYPTMMSKVGMNFTILLDRLITLAISK